MGWHISTRPPPFPPCPPPPSPSKYGLAYFHLNSQDKFHEISNDTRQNITSRSIASATCDTNSQIENINENAPLLMHLLLQPLVFIIMQLNHVRCIPRLSVISAYAGYIHNRITDETNSITLTADVGDKSWCEPSRRTMFFKSLWMQDRPVVENVTIQNWSFDNQTICDSTLRLSVSGCRKFLCPLGKCNLSITSRCLCN